MPDFRLFYTASMLHGIFKVDFSAWKPANRALFCVCGFSRSFAGNLHDTSSIPMSSSTKWAMIKIHTIHSGQTMSSQHELRDAMGYLWLLKMAIDIIEIVSFPIKHGGSFPTIPTIYGSGSGPLLDSWLEMGMGQNHSKSISSMGPS